MAQKKVYDKEFKVQAVKPGREISFSKAAKEPGINVDTLYGWSGGRITGKIAFYCEVLQVSRQGFYSFLKHRDAPWKYEGVAEKMRAIITEDECNDTYGRSRMHDALKQKYPDEDIPGERTVYRIMEAIGISHRPKRKPNGIAKADKDARKSDDLLKRDFRSDKPLEKCVTDITEIPAKDRNPC